jgi:DtxR family transcriptional regulator, Mn-dependent transcriptional regulator
MHKAFEEILETIWTGAEDGEASLEGLRARCPIAITEDQLAALVKRGQIRREGERLELTTAGKEAARGVVRRHRLAATLFGTILDMDPVKREEIACQVEHTLLPEVEEGICTLLGHPTTAPDGLPIPPGHCCEVGQKAARSVIVDLTRLAPGDRGRITYIKPRDHERLHRLSSFGLAPGIVVELHQRSPAYCIRYEGTELALSEDVAQDIFVAKITNGG